MSKFNYEKTQWVNGVTIVSAERLNKIEDELVELNDQLSDLALKTPGANSKQLTEVNLNNDNIVFAYSDGSNSTIMLERDNDGLVTKFIKEDGSSIDINVNLTRLS